MALTRVYQSIPLRSHEEVRLDERASHHLSRVLRASVGESVVVFNGEGGEYPGTITRIDKKCVYVKLKDWVSREVESPLQITLAQAMVRGEKMDFIVQKAVELGVATFMPLVSERANVRLDAEREIKRMAHWQAIIAGACEQSGRNRLPCLRAPTSFGECLTGVSPAAKKWILCPGEGERLLGSVPPDGAEIVLLIGPEGGFSQAEIDLAIASGFQRLNLGPRVLRAETATIAALAAISAVFER